MKFRHSLPALAFCLTLMPPLSAANPADWVGDHQVLRGDNLWNIAGDTLKDPFLWPLIYVANSGLIGDPDLIQPGWRLSMPMNPGDDEIKAALDIARLYKESVPMPAARTKAPPITASAAPQEQAFPAEPLQPIIPEDAITIMFAIYMVLISLAAAGVALLHMAEAPHHEVPLTNPQGLHLAPWASINEISGNAMPEMDGDELKEAA